MDQKNILITSQPCVLGYFNAGHHISLYETSAYLRKYGNTVMVTDASATLGLTWKDVPLMLRKNRLDMVAILNDFDIIEGFGRLVEYVREFSPHSKIVTFGRLSSRLPTYYQQFAIDGIVCSGDYESGLAGFLGWLNGKGYPAGVAVRENSGWVNPTEQGVSLAMADLVLPDVNEIPYASYGMLYGNDLSRFCGIPDRMELIVPVARGCPVGCDFCEVWQREGLKERRISVQQAIDYIKESFAMLPFEYVSFYAPTFTLKKSWVRELCIAMKEQGVLHPWKCTTTQFHLDEELINAMAALKCLRISIGVETLENEALGLLPMAKRQKCDGFDQVYGWCKKAGIELNCFIVVGLPGTTVEGTRETFEYLNKDGIRVRPSIYSDYSLLRPNMTEQEAVHVLGRHILPEKLGFSESDRAKLYELAFGLDQATEVAKNIPTHS